jgi:hypothetical protein
MLNNRSFVAIVGCFLVASAHGAYAQPPIGFERWTTPPSSGIVFGYNFADLFTLYSNPAQAIDDTLFAPGIPRVIRSKRVIDIEVRNISSPLAHNVVDAVWVENTGIFQMDSWLINRMTKQQLQQWTRYRGYVMVDIERYVRGNQYYYAGILQRNPHGVEWHILFDETIDTINLLAAVSNMRVLDIDFVGTQCGRNTPPGQACVEPLYNAILVENTGNNAIPWHLEDDWNYSGHAVPSGYQLIDREKIPNTSAGDNWFSAYLCAPRSQPPRRWHHPAAQLCFPRE